MVVKNNQKFETMTEVGRNPPSAPDGPRSIYDEGCIGAHALDALGERWAILVVRELLYGPKRFSLIRAGLPGISASVLIQRLEGLEARGVVERMRLPEPAEVQVYGLTPLGQATRPLIVELCRWGVRVPGHDPCKPISPSSLMMSMEAMALPGVAAITAGFDFGRERFTGRLERGVWRVERGEGDAEIAFAGSPNALAPVIYGRAPLVYWLERGAGAGVGFRGDPVVGQRFVDGFSLRPRDGAGAQGSGGAG
jgi:DNA-binding HxlR family transcriptional regulator